MTAEPEKPIELSRYCVPFTPFDKTLSESKIALVSTAGVFLKGDAVFIAAGDNSFRVIPGDAKAADLAYSDEHYPHACVDADMNCVFPVDRIHELAAEGFIAGAAESHFSMGFTQELAKIRATTIPQIARAVDRVRPDAVILTGG